MSGRLLPIPRASQDPIFSVNDSATANATTATFSAAGQYELQVTVANQGGRTTIEGPTLDVGAHTIAAIYSGDGNFGGSSSAINEAINAASTTTTVSLLDPVLQGGTETEFTATVAATSTSAVTNGGTVQFTSDGYTVQSGGTLSIPAGTTIDVAPNASATIAATVTGAGGLTKTDGGTLQLNGYNSYTGPTSVQGGMLNNLHTGLSTFSLSGGSVSGDLIVNGSFEYPDVFTTGYNWYAYASIPGWTRMDTSASAPLIEVDTSGAIMPTRAGDGQQSVELDADLVPPDQQKPANDYGSMGIYQNMATVPGQSYWLHFDFAGRSGISDNALDAIVTDVKLGQCAFEPNRVHHSAHLERL